MLKENREDHLLKSEGDVEKFVSGFQKDVREFLKFPYDDPEVKFEGEDIFFNFKDKLAEKIIKLLKRFSNKKFDIQISEENYNSGEKDDRTEEPIFWICGRIKINGEEVAEYFRESPGARITRRVINWKEQERRRGEQSLRALRSVPLAENAAYPQTRPEDPLTRMLK